LSESHPRNGLGMLSGRIGVPSLLGDGAFDPAESGKFVRARELGEEIAARQEKAPVFTQFKEMTGPLATYLERIFVYGPKN
jgi:hypothetical protein